MRGSDGERERTDLSEQERAVLSLLGAPLQRDELIRAIGLPTSEATTLLSDMELKGLIADTFGEIRKG
jgi:DNA-binding IclR family transcriptional regulator